MLKVNVKKVLDLQKIQRFLHQSEVEILVGFPSGRQHVETLHRKKDGKYKNDFGEPEDMKPIETADLAKELHYGTAVIPARPFLDQGIASKKDELSREYQKQLQNLHEGKGANWQKVATKAVGAVQEFVRGDYYRQNVPNSPKTVEYKESDKPLIDGGDLIGSLTFVINGKVAQEEGQK